MVEINLLPWRQARKKRNTRWGVGGLFVAILLPILLVVGMRRTLESSGLHQQRRNQQLERALLLLSPALQQITNLKASRAILLRQRLRLNVLKGSRQQVVRLLYDVAHAVPKGVSLTQLEFKNGLVTLHGDAQKTRGVTRLMHRLAATGRHRKPTLLEMKKIDANHAFILQLEWGEGAHTAPKSREAGRNKAHTG